VDQYSLPFVPGPVRVPAGVLAARERDFPSTDLEPAFFEQYARVQRQLSTILDTVHPPAIMLGEGMLGLWGALKSCIAPGDRVLCVSTGLFGEGFAEMAQGLGAEVRLVAFGDDEVADPDRVEQEVRAFRPKIVTAVHCETPSGTLNPIVDIGQVLDRYDVEVYLVDAVASAGGVPVEVDGARVDLCLVGSQKCLSAPPDLAIVAVSPRAWETIERVNYQGYDALAPFECAVEKNWFPYTHSWQAIAGLEAACGLLLDEGLPIVYARHVAAALRCRDLGREIGLEIFPKNANHSSPTVTAFRVPEGVDWPDLNRRLRQRGLLVGGNWGRLAGRVFRMGHMGTQADVRQVEAAMDVLASELR
jgi:aspartate aminotransferase-like enzyme